MKIKNIDIRFRIPVSIKLKMIADLKRTHSHAFERVGFLFTKSKHLKNGSTIIIASEYIPVADEDYLRNESVGACIGANAIRKGMQGLYNRKSGCFHVHLHNHTGRPSPSGTDIKGIPGVVESFSNISGDQLNGYLILSYDSFYASVMVKGKKKLQQPNLISEIGYPFRLHYENQKREDKNEMFNRQSFLGKDSEFLFKKVRIGIIGYGGGGSHVGQQLAHVGIINIIVFDDDRIEISNMNRLIGAWLSDVAKKLLKTKIARRVIKKILPNAIVKSVTTKWQNEPELLQSCDIIIGCVDTYSERQQLEAECRRYLIPYIDIGMDVLEEQDKSYSMFGQIILSMPGSACMNCYGFLTEEKLGEEAGKYGDVGGRPQVVWPNGVLASTAVGVLIDIITGWTKEKDKNVYLSYDGNTGHLTDHIRIKFAPKQCKHFLLINAGPVSFKIL